MAGCLLVSLVGGSASCQGCLVTPVGVVDALPQKALSFGFSSRLRRSLVFSTFNPTIETLRPASYTIHFLFLLSCPPE
jgi:hypothetical protein